ncbi:MAG TPA: hypothetical protein VLG11_00440 [Candidatus Saccharimonadales bacterium]|nr:hypothetical protein [Candidatus Saccharimonadales bacterium]
MSYTHVPPSVTEKFEQTLADHNLHAVVAAGEEFAPYADPTTDFFRKFRHPNVNVHSYVHDRYLQADDFRAALVIDDAGGVAGTHWSQRVTLEELGSECDVLESIARMQQYLRPGNLQYFFASELLVRPDLQGLGLGSGLRALTQLAIRETATEPAMLVSLICHQKGATEDNASEISARKVGLMPTGISYSGRARISSRFMLDYWYGMLRPGADAPL